MLFKLCLIKDESSQETAHSNGPFLAVSLCGHFETGRRRGQEKAKVKPKNNSKKAQCLTERKKMWFLLFPTVKGNTSFYIYNSFVFSWMIHQLNIIGWVQEWTNGGGDTAWPWTPAGASPPQNTHNKRECQITPKGITSNTKRGQKSPLTKAPMGYLGKKFMHKGNGDFIATCGIWVFLPLLSVQDIGAFQSCGESHSERKSTCYLPIPPPSPSNRDLLCYQTLAACCEFGLRPGLHKQWTWTEASKDVATDNLGFIHFALHLHGGCMKPFLITVSWNSELL